MTNTRVVAALGIALVVAGFAAGTGYWLGAQRSATPATKLGAADEASPPGSPSAPATTAAPAKAERRVLYWYDPMYPQQKFDKPGKSPYMDMALQPKYADEAGDGGGGVNIDPRVVQNLGVRTAAVETGALAQRTDAVGSVEADQHRVVAVQARAPGWVETLKVRAVNDRVARGQLLAEVYSPEILAAQEEYLLLSAHGRDGEDGRLRTAARDRLAYLGVPPTQIDALERSGKAHPRIGLFAPTDGVVLEIGAKEGGQVNPGINLFTLVDLSGVWLHAQVPEDQLFRVAPGARVEARLKALPGQLFEGRVDYIYPDVDTATRTVRVRSVLRNPGQRLRPGMVADVSIAGGDKRSLLLVPSEAVIYTGKRNVVIVTDGPGQFRAVEVKTGQEAQGKTEVTAGLSAGQRVVVSGQFLIESEASLSSALVRLQSTGVQAPESLHAGHDAGGSIKAPESGHAGHGASGVVGPNPASATHQGEGTVESIDVGASKVVLAHGPIKTLDWPPMTMGFAVPDQKLLGSLNAGDVVRFSFREDAAGDYVIIAIEPKGGGRRTP